MEVPVLIILSCLALGTAAWSVPFYPVHAAQRIPHRFIRHVRHVHAPPPAMQPIRVLSVHEHEEQRQQRPKRDHDYEHDHYGHDRGHDHSRGHDHNRGVTGPIHTFVKTDKNANYKWGVRHHVGNKYAS